MKKILIVLLMIFVAAGCAKKYVAPSQEPAVQKETAKQQPVEPVKKEMVKEMVEPKEAKLQGSAVSTTEEMSALKDVLFDYDKYNIRDDARPVLDNVASFLRKNGTINILIEGHCDERGTNEYNLALGEKRAKAAKDYLISLGVMPARLSIITYGEEKPLCTEHTETCWQKNRRAHFVVTEK
jgi:peptidoglycan-associated lipoprotein